MKAPEIANEVLTGSFQQVCQSPTFGVHPAPAHSIVASKSR